MTDKITLSEAWSALYSLREDFDEHDCHSSPEDGCQGCLWVLEQLENLYENVKASDIGVKEQIEILREIGADLKKNFNEIDYFGEVNYK